MSLWQLEPVQDGPRNLPLKFGKNRVSNSWDIADIEFLWVGWGYLSCYWPDFDQTLKVGSWDIVEQVPTVTVTFVKATFVLATFVHIRNISADTDLILTKLQK